MSYRFEGYVFCPIAGRRCPNTEDTHAYCIFGESEAADEYGNPVLTSCLVYDFLLTVEGTVHDGGLPVSVRGHVDASGSQLVVL